MQGSTAIPLVSALIFLPGQYEVQGQPCAARTLPGKDSPSCVCNCTYCDKIEPIGNIDTNTVVTYTTTKSGKRLERSTSTKKTNKGKSLLDQSCIINTMDTFQTVRGFGASVGYLAHIVMCLNDTCSNSNLKKKLLESYYSDDGGLNYSMARLQFSIEDGSYDDTDGDFDLTNWQLRPQDIKLKIPILQHIQQIANNLKVVASTWSAPYWMKRCNCTISSIDPWLIAFPGKRMMKGEPCGNDSAYYQTWANYFVKFIQAYQANNIPIWAVTTQNEPVFSHVVKWQSQIYFPWTEADFGKCHLCPALRAAGLDTKWFIYDDNRGPWLPAWVKYIADDPDARECVSGVALHWYFNYFVHPGVLDALRPQELDIVQKEFPELELLNTESSGSAMYPLTFLGIVPERKGMWQTAVDYAKAIIQDMRHWVTGWIDWQMAVYKDSPDDGAIVVNETCQEFYKQPQYYAMGHFSKFVPPGSTRIGLNLQKTLPTDFPIIAFQRPDGIIAVIAVNDLNRPVVSSIVSLANHATGKSIHIDLPGNSITTTLFRP